jgi:hypothetical protein
LDSLGVAWRHEDPDGGPSPLGRERGAEQRQSERGHHGREADQQRQARRHERPERDDEDDQRDRDGQHPGLPEVVLDDLVDGLVGAGAAELLDRQIRVICLDGGHGIEGGRHSVLRLRRIAGDLEPHQCGVAVARDVAVAGERRLHVLDVADL